jgi:hypothetical protein
MLCFSPIKKLNRFVEKNMKKNFNLDLESGGQVRGFDWARGKGSTIALSIWIKTKDLFERNRLTIMISGFT